MGLYEKRNGRYVKTMGGGGSGGGMLPADPSYTLTDADKAAIASAVKAALTTERWTFTLEDGSTVEKAVYVG